MIGKMIAKAMFSLRIWWEGSNDWETGKTNTASQFSESNLLSYFKLNTNLMFPQR
jgi:hypothetical protein